MNDRNLKLVLQNYIRRFDEMNDAKHNETYKWEAVRHFQEHWNADADDFGAMFRSATGATENLINNHVVQPTAGIAELARQAPDAVRALFSSLYADDGGNLKQRQERIEAFIAEANQLLAKHAPGKWKLAQDMRSVIFYLNLRFPDDNYIYKATPARSFGRCVEFGHEIGSGQDFRLSQYYRMCDELVEAIEATPELLKIHHHRLGPRAYADDHFHILAYDIIFCAQTYGLYTGIESRPAHSRRPGSLSGAGGASGGSRTGRQTRLKEEEKARVNLRQERLDAIQAELDSVLIRRHLVEELPLKGITVEHRKYGTGTVVSQHDEIITVRFAQCDRKFALPCAFTDCFLSTNDDAVRQSYAIMAEVLREQKRLEHERQSIQCETP